jgi:hypothetical protein
MLDWFFLHVFFFIIYLNNFISSPPDIPEHLTTSHEFHRLPLHQNDPTIKLSTNTLINDEHNGSFEDEENYDEHSHPVDHPDSQPSNVGTIVKAYALYDFNGTTTNKKNGISFEQ